jgi:hypothetical protein
VRWNAGERGCLAGIPPAFENTLRGFTWGARNDGTALGKPWNAGRGQ